MARIALLANRLSGGGEAAEVDRLLAAREPGTRAFELDELEAVAQWRPERIVVAGGDGTIGPAAELAARTGAPLAVVPVGTANDFARALDLPRDSLAAVELALDGKRLRAVDLGTHARNDATHPFVNAASAGLSPVAAREAHGLKRLVGPLAYALGAIRAGARARPVLARVRCDGREAFAGSAWQVTVAVTGAFGGGAEVAADPHDGLLDVVVIEAGSRAQLLLHAYGVRSGRPERHEDVRTARGREVEVEVEGDAGFNVDGELVDARALRFAAAPRAFEVVVG